MFKILKKVKNQFVRNNKSHINLLEEELKKLDLLEKDIQKLKYERDSYKIALDHCIKTHQVDILILEARYKALDDVLDIVSTQSNVSLSDIKTVPISLINRQISLLRNEAKELRNKHNENF